MYRGVQNKHLHFFCLTCMSARFWKERPGIYSCREAPERNTVTRSYLSEDELKGTHMLSCRSKYREMLPATALEVCHPPLRSKPGEPLLPSLFAPDYDHPRAGVLCSCRPHCAPVRNPDVCGVARAERATTAPPPRQRASDRSTEQASERDRERESQRRLNLIRRDAESRAFCPE